MVDKKDIGVSISCFEDIGLVNIITFVYQMKDRKQNKVKGQ
jgi:hypothetical protein